jgi:hypothetical protein
MNLIKKTGIGLKAAFQLGPAQITNYLHYQAGLRSGYYHLRTPSASMNQLLPDDAFIPVWFMHQPEKNAFSIFGEEYLHRVIKEADEISEGQVRLFGADPVPLNFSIPGLISHWTRHETGKIQLPVEDIKFLWEPARFGWAIALGKAYFLTRNKQYPEVFWKYFGEFTRKNPLNKGPNWQSGQEVALRLIAFVISLNLLKLSFKSDSKRARPVFELIADHAERILPTLAYAKAQKNNHLISEAVGLYTAGVFLSRYPRSEKWKKIGLEIFNQAVQNQIGFDGEYIQHSTNYHRMVLMLCLWMQYLLETEGKEFESQTGKKLALATSWLAGQMDFLSGKAPNLGHNDGSNILPFTTADYSDFRPVVQASSRAFLAKAALPAGKWDDLCIWLGLPNSPVLPDSIDLKKLWQENRIGTQESWASMRAVRYNSRPAHADQLHVEIWHRGINVACDAGTYLYNAAPPWDNRLSTTLVHNTIAINNHDQMMRASRFLWLDWSKAKIVANNPNVINGIQDGYIKFGVIHKRKLENQNKKGWLITDKLVQVNGKNVKRSILLNWLLPDWPFEIISNTLSFNAPFDEMRVELFTHAGIVADRLNIIRAGISLVSKADSIHHGWYSPTYGVKTPALSIQYNVDGLLPVEIITRFSFME